jgi:hypothetical protein
MRPRRRRTAIAVIRIVANLVGIAGLTLLHSPVMVLGDTTTTMMWTSAQRSVRGPVPRSRAIRSCSVSQVADKKTAGSALTI